MFSNDVCRWRDAVDVRKEALYLLKHNDELEGNASLVYIEERGGAFFMCGARVVCRGNAHVKFFGPIPKVSHIEPISAESLVAALDNISDDGSNLSHEQLLKERAALLGLIRRLLKTLQRHDAILSSAIGAVGKIAKSVCDAAFAELPASKKD